MHMEGLYAWNDVTLHIGLCFGECNFIRRIMPFVSSGVEQENIMVSYIKETVTHR